MGFNSREADVVLMTATRLRLYMKIYTKGRAFVNPASGNDFMSMGYSLIGRLEVFSSHIAFRDLTIQ